MNLGHVLTQALGSEHPLGRKCTRDLSLSLALVGQALCQPLKEDWGPALPTLTMPSIE